MADDFYIEKLTGTGPARVKVKPLSNNNGGSDKELVLIIEAEGTQRSVTLRQRSKGSSYEYKLVLSSESVELPSTGGIATITVVSQKRLMSGSEPQGDWEDTLFSVGFKEETPFGVNLDINVPEKYFKINITSTNYSKLPLVGKLTVVQPGGKTLDFTITQKPGEITYIYSIYPKIELEGLNPGASTSIVGKSAYIVGYRGEYIHGKFSGKTEVKFKIPTLKQARVITKGQLKVEYSVFQFDETVLTQFKDGLYLYAQAKKDGIAPSEYGLTLPDGTWEAEFEDGGTGLFKVMGVISVNGFEEP